MIALLFDFAFLYNIITNFVVDWVADFAFFGEGVQYFKFFVHFDLLLSDGVDEVANTVDVVTEEDAGGEGDEDDEGCFDVVGCV